MIDGKLAVIEGAGDVCRLTLNTVYEVNIDAVWAAVTDVEQFKVWWPDWAPGGILEAKEGGRVRLGDGAWIDGQVKVWAPPHLLEFSWRESAASGDWFESTTKSLVRIELVNLGQKSTGFTLIQFAPRSSVVGGTAGWHYFAGERLKALLEDLPQDNRPERFQELVTLYSSEVQ